MAERREARVILRHRENGYFIISSFLEIVDSDPVSLSNTHTPQESIKYLIIINKGLCVYGDQGSWVICGGFVLYIQHDHFT